MTNRKLVKTKMEETYRRIVDVNTVVLLQYIQFGSVIGRYAYRKELLLFALITCHYYYNWRARKVKKL